MEAEAFAPEAHRRVLDTPDFSTESVSDCRDFLNDRARTQTEIFGFELSSGSELLHFSRRLLSCGRVAIGFLQKNSTEGFSIAKAYSKTISFHFVLGGRCKLRGKFGERTAHPGDIFVLPPGPVSTEYWEKDCSLIIVQLEQEIIDNAISQELGKTMSRSVDFEPVMRDPGITPWLFHIAHHLSAPAVGALGNWRVTRDLERTLVTMLASGLLHSESDNLARQNHGVAPYYVRRAETFIRENAREPLTIETIAESAGVSPRSLFYGFKRWRNTTPMALARVIRLDIARDELTKARLGGGSVSQAAVNAGFTDFSQFSRLYKARFNETPSATLRGS